MLLDTLGADGSEGDRQQCSHGCPKPCHQTVYEPALSYALLSSMSVDQILTEDSTELQRRYDNALETRQRTDGDIFTDDLNVLSELIKYYDDIMRLVKEYLTSDEEALFPNLLQAVKTFEANIFLERDLHNLLGSIANFNGVYRKLYDDKKNLLFNYSTVIATNLNEIDQVLYLTSVTNRVHQYAEEVSARGIMYVTMQRETLNLLRDSLLNTSLAVESSFQVLYLPEIFFINQLGCDNRITALNVTLNLLEGNISLINQYASSNRVNNLKRMRDDFRALIDEYNESGNRAKKCLQEYPLLLQETLEWFDRSRELVSNSLGRIDSQDYVVESVLARVEEDHRRVKSARNEYTNAVITKLELLQEILNLGNQDRPTTTISTFTTRVKSWISGPVRQEIQNALDDMEDKYLTGMMYATNISHYLVQYYFYPRAEQMILWREPMPNIERPETYDDMGTELWRIWDRNTHIQDFVDQEAHTYIKSAIEGYFNPLLLIVDTFEEQLDNIEKNLLSMLEEVTKRYQNYLEQREIEHTFVA